MFFKKFKIKSLLILLTLFIIPINIYAYSSEIIAGGQNIGIEIKTSGVLIVGTYKTGEVNPAEKAGLQVGDIITSIDEQPVTTIDEMINSINTKSNEYIKVGFLRNGIISSTDLKLYKDVDSYKTGLYVKDTISGIGTLTFIDPNTKLFGALGHESVNWRSKKK